MNTRSTSSAISIGGRRAYGSDPDNQQDLIESWELPQARADRCVDEYALLDRSWTNLLKGHLREEGDASTVSTESVPRRPTTFGDAIRGEDDEKLPLGPGRPKPVPDCGRRPSLARARLVFIFTFRWQP